MTDSENQEWAIEDGVHGRRMVMRGPWSARAHNEVFRNDIRELELNHAKGWKGNEIGFLDELSEQLSSFSLIDLNIDDIGPVNSLSSLRFLKVFAYCNTQLDFGNFRKLEHCSLDWRLRAESLFEHRGIRCVFINCYRGKNLTDFSSMKQLESLRLKVVHRLESLEGVGSLKKLKCLEVALAPKLASLSGIEHLAQLQQFWIGTCRRIKDISPIGRLVELRELHLTNCGDIDSIEPLRSLKALKKFIFSESTSILDDDLSPLAELSELRKVAFKNRRHYSHSWEDFRQPD